MLVFEESSYLQSMFARFTNVFVHGCNSDHLVGIGSNRLTQLVNFCRI